MKGLDFLKTAKLAANEVVKPVVARTSTAKARNPEKADIRVFKDGAVYPSAALVAEFNLEYTAKDAEQKNNGFDVFLSTEYPNTQGWAAKDRVVFIASVPKDAGKVDMFAQVGYDKESGEPLTSVLTQGANTFGKNLLEYVKATYGIEPTEETPYVDLLIARDYPFNTENGVYYVPKTVSRGEEKGTTTITKRENLTLFPLVPAAWAEEGEEAPAEEPAVKQMVAGAKAPKADSAEEADAISLGSVSK